MNIIVYDANFCEYVCMEVEVSLSFKHLLNPCTIIFPYEGHFRCKNSPA